jgi:hypothetical protein
LLGATVPSLPSAEAGMMEGKPRTAPARAVFFRNERRFSWDMGIGVVRGKTVVMGETFRGKEGLGFEDKRAGG